MSVLNNRRAHIAAKEARIRESLGKDIIINTQVRVQNPDYDEFYKAALGSDGYTTTIIPITYRCVIFWITEQEMENQAFGQMEVGNCLLRADIAALTNFQSATEKGWEIIVDGESMLSTRVMKGDLDTEISVHLVKQKKDIDDE